MKRVRLLKLITGPRGRFAEGAEIHVDDDEAEQLIADHAAIEVPEPAVILHPEVAEAIEDETLEAPENADGLPTRRGRRR